VVAHTSESGTCSETGSPPVPSGLVHQPSVISSSISSLSW
jgi:hypothetical protein